MKVYSTMLFLICLNLAAFIIQQSGAIVGSQPLYINPFDIQNQFDLAIITGSLLSVSAVGVITLIFTPGIYALGALLIGVLVIITPITQWLLLGTPKLLASILPGELAYLSAVVSAFFTVMFFMFLLEIVSQRQIT